MKKYKLSATEFTNEILFNSDLDLLIVVQAFQKIYKINEFSVSVVRQIGILQIMQQYKLVEGFDGFKWVNQGLKKECLGGCLNN